MPAVEGAEEEKPPLPLLAVLAVLLLLLPPLPRGRGTRWFIPPPPTEGGAVTGAEIPEDAEEAPPPRGSLIFNLAVIEG